MRPYYARWTDTGRPVYRLSRAGHLKASAPVPGAVLPPFVRSSNRRRNGCAFVNPHGNDVVPVREVPVPRRPGPVKLFSQPHHRDRNHRLQIRQGRCHGPDQCRSER